MNRRRVLHSAFLVGSTALAGCLFHSGVEAGSLIVDNDGDEQRTVLVAVSMVSGEASDARQGNRPPPGETPPEWTRRQQFTVDPGERAIESTYVPEPGAYLVEASLEIGVSDSDWIGVTESTDGGISSGSILVEISGDDRLAVRRHVRV